MRTTIDLPDDLFRRVKAVAALRGLKLKELVASLVEGGLGETPAPSTTGGHVRETRPPGSRQTLPNFITTVSPIPLLTNEQIETILLQDDLESLGLDRSA